MMSKPRTTTPPLPLRPCSLCDFFILTGADPDGLAPYAHCDRSGFEREIYPGAEVLRCHGFLFRSNYDPKTGARKAAKDPAAPSGLGIGALITTDAKSQFETNRPENTMRDALRGVA